MSIREHFSRNERNRRTLQRGKAPRRDRAAAEVKSRVPVYRKRINPATGRPHTDDPMMHQSRNKGLAQGKQAQERTEQAHRDRTEQASRARASADAAAARWDDPLPGERRQRRDTPARKPPGRAAR